MNERCPLTILRGWSATGDSEELRKNLLEHPDLDKVIHKVFEVALDDQHKHQTAAQKILMDRAIPVNSFDKTFDNQLGINIHITTADIPKVINP